MEGNAERVVVFEGFFDFLSPIMMHGGVPEATIIVLNSVSMRDKAIAAIRKINSRTVELYRDRDDAGEQLLERFREALPNTEVIDKSNCYAAHDDLNDWFAAKNHQIEHGLPDQHQTDWREFAMIHVLRAE